jgi:hypothetical protein
MLAVTIHELGLSGLLASAEIIGGLEQGDGETQGQQRLLRRSGSVNRSFAAVHDRAWARLEALFLGHMRSSSAVVLTCGCALTVCYLNARGRCRNYSLQGKRQSTASFC